MTMPADPSLVKRVVEVCGWRAEAELGEGVVRLMGGEDQRGDLRPIDTSYITPSYCGLWSLPTCNDGTLEDANSV